MPRGEVVPIRSRSRSSHARLIKEAWQKGVGSIIETGKRLIEAKAELIHGVWLDMIRDDLPFSSGTASRLMKIAEHEVVSNVAHVPHLPPSWGTLYELTKLPDRVLIRGLENGTINPQIERSEVRAMLPISLTVRTPPPIDEFMIKVKRRLEKVPSEKLLQEIEQLIEFQADMNELSRSDLKHSLKEVAERFVNLAERITR